MGYYHAGHASLISYARSMADKVIVSLFVNPTQFGPNEDLEAYPRDFEKDSALVRELGGDVLYAPEPENMYAPDHATWVEVPALANTLCGLSRPIHFRGVCTVVLKLFMLAQPSLAVFGEKDWQQLAIIKKMVSDLNVPVEVVGRPIVREADGLALSSRNVYLTPEERAQAPQIRKSLEMAAGLAAGGERDAARIIEAVRGYLAEHLPTGEEDYISIVDPAVLTKVDRIEDMALCALAIRLGKARLIDNILLKVGSEDESGGGEETFLKKGFLPPSPSKDFLTLSNPVRRTGDTWEFFVFLGREEKKRLGDFFFLKAHYF